jgi:uncharacterized membrane protein
MSNKSYVWKVLFGTAAAAAVASVIVRRTSKYPGIKLKKSIIVDRTPEDLYPYWRNFENLPRFMEMIETVEVIDDRHSHWTVLGPGGVHLGWDSEVIVDRRNEMIGLQSGKGSVIDIAGSVRFERATGGRGTIVRVALQYNPPGGKLGVAVTSLFGKRPGRHIEDALRRFKQLVETGEIATAGRKAIPGEVAALRVPEFATSEEPVQEASEESFPASDAPSWTGTTGTRH